MQSLIGSCTKDEIACRLATRVIGHNPANNDMLIDCGFLAISYDGMKLNPNDFATFTDDPDLTYVNIAIFIRIYQTLPRMDFYFTTHTLRSSLQFVFKLFMSPYSQY